MGQLRKQLLYVVYIYVVCVRARTPRIQNKYRVHMCMFRYVSLSLCSVSDRFSLVLLFFEQKIKIK